MPFQVYAYLAVGAANTVFNIVLFTVCYWLIAARAVSVAGVQIHTLAVETATVISFGVTVITGFWLSKNFAFATASDDKNEKAKQFGRYFLVSLQGQFSDYLITKALIMLLFIKPVIAYFTSTFIMLAVNYFLQKYYTFKAKKTITV
jgi:putative flippase GtrA